MMLTTLGIKDFIPLILIVSVIYMLKAGILAAIWLAYGCSGKNSETENKKRPPAGGLFHYQIKGRRRYLTFFL